MNFEDIALHIPVIHLPKKGIDLTKWSVVACDQYTSQPEKWEMMKEIIGDSPSTLHLIFPEVYLDNRNQEQRIKEIIHAMELYLQNQILVPLNPGFILVDRKTSHGLSRKGLIVALDLEHYDFREDSKTRIRATEGTVVDRLPPRIKIRQKALIELPHIMVLIDDPEKTVIEPLFQKELKKVYDFDLMMRNGHVTGYSIDDEETIHAIAAKLARLADPEMFKKKYDVSDNHVLLYAMGDGNHSLATAKTIWETMKNEAKDKVAIMQHPARYSLVELVNVHDEGLEFAPIHRLAFDVNIHDLFDHMKSFYEKQGSQFAYTAVSTLQEPHQHATAQPNTHIIPFVAQNMQGIISVHNPKLHLEVATLQSFLDDYMKDSKSAKIDYVHDKDVVAELGAKPNNIGFYLPAISKYAFFKTIIVDGALPSKTFSMGKADEKRFYLECRKITS